MIDFKEEKIANENFDSSGKKILDELLEELQNPIHKRLIQSYHGNVPLKSMEEELRKILTEIYNLED